MFLAVFCQFCWLGCDELGGNRGLVVVIGGGDFLIFHKGGGIGDG
jgi:hypothetical protein